MAEVAQISFGWWGHFNWRYENMVHRKFTTQMQLPSNF